jgi:hypothetical protein
MHGRPGDLTRLRLRQFRPPSPPKAFEEDVQRMREALAREQEEAKVRLPRAGGVGIRTHAHMRAGDVGMRERPYHGHAVMRGCP